MEIFVQSPYFTDDKTEAQKEKVICMMSHNLVTWSICQDQRHLLGILMKQLSLLLSSFLLHRAFIWNFSKYMQLNFLNFFEFYVL